MPTKSFFLKATFIRDLLGISLGTMIASWGIAFFLIPFKAAPGGVSALSQIAYYVWGMNPGSAMLMLNIPLFFIGLLTLGRMFGIKTIFAIIALGSFTHLFSSDWFWQVEPIKPFIYLINEKAHSFTNEQFLGVMAGAMLLGIGLGIVFNFNGSCGSTDIPALLLKKYFGVTVGTGYLMIDTVIIVVSGICFKNANYIFWGLFSLFITSKVTDRIMQGLSYVRGVFIISDQYEEIRRLILEEIQRGCTVFKAEGGYTRQEKNVIYTVTNIHELARLKNLVKRADPKAFVIVNEVNDVWGKGFHLLT